MKWQRGARLDAGDDEFRRRLSARVLSWAVVVIVGGWGLGHAMAHAVQFGLAASTGTYAP